MSRVEVEGGYLDGLQRRLAAAWHIVEDVKRRETPNPATDGIYSWFLKAEGESPGWEVASGEAANFAALANSAAVFAAGKNVAVTRSAETIQLATGMTLRQGAGSDVGPRPRISLIEGTGISFTVADDGNEIDVTVNALGYGVKVRKNSTGAGGGPRSRLNLIEGAAISITVADDSGDDEIDTTLAVLFAGSGSATTVAHSDHTHGGGGGLTTTITICCFTGSSNYRTHTLGFTSGSIDSYSYSDSSSACA